MKNMLILIVILLELTYMFMHTANAKSQQTTDTLIMISPDHFQFNAQTALTNGFQKPIFHEQLVTKKALSEFTDMVKQLRANQINVIVLSSRSTVNTPDAVFPNNWFSTHPLGDSKSVLVIYPMQAENRRLEKQILELRMALQKNSIHISKVIDLSYFENQAKALEGTGSLVLDRENKIAFASLSPRTDPEVLKIFSKELGYKLMVFSSFNKDGQPIYHTNIMMNVGEKFAVLCDTCIKDVVERGEVVNILKAHGKKIISISLKQAEQMAGNLLQVYSKDKKSKIILSHTAYDAFSATQRKLLASFGELVIVNIPTIEAIGGGSARCMLAEVFY